MSVLTSVSCSHRWPSRHVERFTRVGGYIDRLLAKARRGGQPRCRSTRLRQQRAAPLAGIPLMITCRVEPAAFVPNPRIAFTIVTELSGVIDADRELLL